jgi:hypothetical protein
VHDRPPNRGPLHRVHEPGSWLGSSAWSSPGLVHNPVNLHHFAFPSAYKYHSLYINHSLVRASRPYLGHTATVLLWRLGAKTSASTSGYGVVISHGSFSFPGFLCSPLFKSNLATGVSALERFQRQRGGTVGSVLPLYSFPPCHWVRLSISAFLGSGALFRLVLPPGVRRL